MVVCAVLTIRHEQLNAKKNRSSNVSDDQRLESRVFEHEREDHVFNLTTKLVRNAGVLGVNRVLQVDGSRNEEDTGGGSVLGIDDGTEDLDTDQPEDH